MVIRSRMEIFNRAKKLFQKGGWRKFGQRIADERRRKRETINYQKWIAAHRLTTIGRENLRGAIEAFNKKPLISVLLPVYNVEEKWLRRCIESVTNQIYENWELCIADDCSPSPHVKRVLEEYAAKDGRIKIVFRETNNHISAASNSALELATGEFTALLDHDDEFSEDALFYVAKEINDFPATDFIYTDEDMIDENGRRYTPKFKPDFSRDFLYSVNYVTHLAVYRTSILREIGGFSVGVEGSQDYDLALRVIERIPENNVRHIPRVLYHWRAIRGSVAFSSDEKPYAHERARDALRLHFERIGKKATVDQAIYNLHRVRYALPAVLPKVGLIFSASDDFAISEKQIENSIAQTDYENLQTVKIVVGEKQTEAEQLNIAAALIDAEILCFVDANLKPLSKDWLKELVSFAVQTEIGAVGARLLCADETILHGGLIIGIGETVGIAHRRFAGETDGYFLRARLTNNFSAVSASCLVVRREAFREIGGFDAKNLPNKFFDADFCLKLREKNYRVVFTPYAELIKIDEKRQTNLEKKSSAEEKNYFVKRWSKFVERDSFYNPNLSKTGESFSIET